MPQRRRSYAGSMVRYKEEMQRPARRARGGGHRLGRRLAPRALPLLWALFRGTLVNAELRPMTQLVSNCYDFPARNFDLVSSIKALHHHTPHMPMSIGDDAIDFELHDLDGGPWVLSRALKEERLPVVMIWGMYTCPAYQGMNGDHPFDKSSYWDEYNLVDLYKDRATFVHLYGAEPHPLPPATNVDIGTQRPQYWSVVDQHQTYAERVAMARTVRRVVHPAEVILPDYLPGNPYSHLVQPVWCSYAHGARPVTMMSPEGSIVYQRGCFRSGHVAAAIESFWNGTAIIGSAGRHSQHRGLVDEGEGLLP